MSGDDFLYSSDLNGDSFEFDEDEEELGGDFADMLTSQLMQNLGIPMPGGGMVRSFIEFKGSKF